MSYDKHSVCDKHRDRGVPSLETQCLCCFAERLQHKLQEVKADAERYRWLRNKSTPERCKIYLATDYREQSLLPGDLDDAIDADIRAGYQSDASDE
jgi:hypothetical protein